MKSNALSAHPDEWVLGYPGGANSSLTYVRTSRNRISGPFPAGLAQALLLNGLDIGSNNLRYTKLLALTLAETCVC